MFPPRQHRPPPSASVRASVITVVVLASLATAGDASAADQSSRPSTGIPQKSPLATVTAAPRGFNVAVELVRLDSCDPAVRARKQPRLEDVAELAERGRARADLDLYHAMLTAYSQGDPAGSIDSVIALDRQRLDRALRSINDAVNDANTPWDAKRYALAVMLHTDAAVRLAGETYGNDMYDQLQLAADLLQLGVRCAPDRLRPLASQWYIGLSRYLRERNALRTAEALLDLGRKRLADDPAILAESGLLAESVATIYALSNAGTRQSWNAGASGILGRVVDRRRAWLNDAATWLGRASALEPGNDDVLLHLGRVQALRFDDTTALRTLGLVLTRTRSADTAYLAAIFIAAIHDRQGRRDEAADAYRKALEHEPGGHAGRVGLAEALRQSGRLDEARGLLQALATEPADTTQEPLWWYLLEPPGKSDARLEALRTEVRR